MQRELFMRSFPEARIFSTFNGLYDPSLYKMYLLLICNGVNLLLLYCVLFHKYSKLLIMIEPFATVR